MNLSPRHTLAVLAILLAAAAGAALQGSPALSLGWYDPDTFCDDALAANPGDSAPCRYGAREADCADGVDGDSDEATDCLDSDCAGAPGCAVAPRCSATELDRDGNCEQDTRGSLYGEPDLCADGHDGDDDGFTDGCDQDCAPGQGGYCRTEDCAAYGDEDGDGAWDGCDQDCAPGDGQDRGCADGEQAAGTRNSGAGRGGGASCFPSAEVCGNGWDEDCDGRDAVCRCPWWNPWCDLSSVCGDRRCDSGESCPADCGTGTPAEACDNDRDDDGDGFADCGDPDCAVESWCQGPSENCNDGGDNDGDGWADCWDSGCTEGVCSVFGGLGAPGWPTDPSRPGGDPRNPTDPNNPGSGSPKGRDPQGKPLGNDDTTCYVCEYQDSFNIYVDGVFKERRTEDKADLYKSSCESWLAGKKVDASRKKLMPFAFNWHQSSVQVNGHNTSLPEEFCYEHGSYAFSVSPSCKDVQTELFGHGTASLANECGQIPTKVCGNNPDVNSVEVGINACSLGYDPTTAAAAVANAVSVLRSLGREVTVTVDVPQSFALDFVKDSGGVITITSTATSTCAITYPLCAERRGEPCVIYSTSHPSTELCSETVQNQCRDSGDLAGLTTLTCIANATQDPNDVIRGRLR